MREKTYSILVPADLRPPLQNASNVFSSQTHLLSQVVFGSARGDHPINGVGAYLTIASCQVGFGQGAHFHHGSLWSVSDSSPRQRFLGGLPSGFMMRPFFSGFPDDLGLHRSFVLRALVGAGGGMGLN